MKIKSLVVTAVLTTAILCCGAAVSAQTPTIAQLQAQIAQLMAQLQALQSQQGTTQAWCHTFTDYLFVGATGDEVSALHTALTKENIDYGGDGQMAFGDSTAAAVVQFQGKYNIRQTGTVGPRTRAKLNALYGCTTTGTLPAGCTSASGFSPLTGQSCASGTTTTPTICTPSWTCGWGPCINGGQQEMPVDSNNCGLSASSATIACPNMLQKCTPSTQPSITVTSPNGGETWQTGTNHTITWSSANLPNDSTVSIYLLPLDANGNILSKGVLLNSNGSNDPSLYTYIQASAGSYSWTIYPWVAKEIVTSTGSSDMSHLKIQISDDGKTGAYDRSDSAFSIVASTTLPPGCTSTSGYSSTTGQPCSAPPGCDSTSGYSITTGQSCSTSTQPSVTLIPSDSFVNFNVVQGSSNPQPYGLHLTNASSSSVNLTISVPNQPAWLNTAYNTQMMFLAAQGVMGVGASVDATKVSGPGTYTTNLIFSGNFSNSPITIPITLTVTSPSTQPTITSVTSVLSSYVAGINNAQFNWNRAGNFTGANNLYFAYLKQTTAQLLGNNSNAPVSYIPIYFRVSSLSYPTFTFTIPSDVASIGGSPITPGTYYLELDYTDTNANILASATSNAFQITASTSTQPSITVNSPNGGEQWQAGSTHNITWNATGLDKVKIWLLSQRSGMTQFEVNSIATNLDASSSYYSWTVPTQPLCNQYSCPSYSGYACQKIEVVDNNYSYSSSKEILGESNNCFSIVAPTTGQPTITVTSPNGGEQWAQGSTHNITWISSGLPSSDQVYIELRGVNDNPRAQFPWESSNSTILLGSGSYSWTIPTNLSTGQYKIKVLDSNTTDSPTIYDDSDNYFSIIAPTVGLNASQNSLASISAAIAKIQAEIQAMLNK